ncbi:uncharacterized protein TEOVI_000328900 [Trypanosoma equiperdum]|uniref:Uncharacterized protein n=1 Tax=Trypanosoma equiperdum TaxID=5694 RepID=A0A1G4IHI2_TRYEQ|nr:hypothetical protein, conserved [Trypanosoma equiperdum]
MAGPSVFRLGNMLCRTKSVWCGILCVFFITSIGAVTYCWNRGLCKSSPQPYCESGLFGSLCLCAFAVFAFASVFCSVLAGWRAWQQQDVRDCFFSLFSCFQCRDYSAPFG